MPESKRRKPKSRTSSSQSAEGAKAKQPSPTWYVAVMSVLMVVGVLLVLARFVFELNQLVLVAGLVAIAIGFLMTTSYR